MLIGTPSTPPAGHGAPEGQPLLAAFGSQSWVPFPPSVEHAATFVLLSRQHTCGEGQSADEAHCKPVAFGSEHPVPDSHAGAPPFCG